MLEELYEDKEYYKSIENMAALEPFQREHFVRFYRRLFYVSAFLQKNIGTNNTDFNHKQDLLAEKFYEDKKTESELESFLNKAEEMYEAVMEFKTFWHLNKNKTQKEMNDERYSFNKSLDPQSRLDNTNKNFVTA